MLRLFEPGPDRTTMPVGGWRGSAQVVSVPPSTRRWAAGSRAGSTSVAVAVGVGVGWRDWRGRRGVGGPGAETRGGHEEALYALAGHLAGGVIEEGVKEMPVVAHLLSVGIGDHAQCASRSGFARRGGNQRGPKGGQTAAYVGLRGRVGTIGVEGQPPGVDQDLFGLAVNLGGRDVDRGRSGRNGCRLTQPA